MPVSRLVLRVVPKILPSLGLIVVLVIASNGAAEEIETGLVGFERSADRLVFHVLSNGCTSKEDFELRSISKNAHLVEVEIVRRHRDQCRRLAQPMAVVYPIGDIAAKGSAVIIRNSFTGSADGTEQVRR